MFKRSTVTTVMTLALVVTIFAAFGTAQGNYNIPERLGRIESALSQLLGLLQSEPTPLNQTRLLIPFATNQAGFDTAIAVANTGLDSTGQVGVAGACTVRYFGRLSSGIPVNQAQTTNSDVAPGETITFLLSAGGSLGLTGVPNFQGYIEVDCAFPFAHGFSIVTDGPIGLNRIASSSPALVLPRVRTNLTTEGLGQ
jgi:hypothetical protein